MYVFGYDLKHAWGKVGNSSTRRKFGDNDDNVGPYRSKSIFWHKIWSECGRPKTGVIADIMRCSRASYHFAIRRVKKNEQKIVWQQFAEAVICNNNRDLWSELRRINGNRAAPTSTTVSLALTVFLVFL